MPRRATCADFSCVQSDSLVVRQTCQESLALLAEDAIARCDDGKDNDGDGFTDCKDFSCSLNPSVTVCKGTPGPENNNTACSDGKDNDDDGYVDCADYDCKNSPSVTLCK